MSATQALIHALALDTGTTSLSGAAVALIGVAVHVVGIAPRLTPRGEAWASLAFAVTLLASSWLLLAFFDVWWPTWPAVLALMFAHLGGWVAGVRHAAHSRVPARTPVTPALKAAPHGVAPPAPAAPSVPASAPAVVQPPPDRMTLGRYQVDRELGRGSMGAVYLGHDPKIGRQVAIKTMALSQEFDGAALVEARARFFREAETAGRLQHRDIVTIFDAGEDQDLAYIAMEYLRGHDLQRHTAIATLLLALFGSPRLP